MRMKAEKKIEAFSESPNKIFKFQKMLKKGKKCQRQKNAIGTLLKD